eukprot:TRINITY_DN4232_c0_g1_i1.p1 TRINITY_DN4232_c0_g1~~TRINITY_DN4232_c0_g1_i1.p1  ORF type:complete len:289 (+),score=66.55 TRINITY_DN4232_c0_g1_i1:179-1045(+)
MAEGNNTNEDATVRGQDWEVVSLTASTYGAAPGPKRPEEGVSVQSEEEAKVVTEERLDSMLLSRHFTFSEASQEAYHIQQDKVQNLNSCESYGKDSCKEPGKVDKISANEGIEKLEYQSEGSKASKHLDWIDPCHHKISSLPPELGIFHNKIDDVSGSKSTFCHEGNVLTDLQKDTQEQAVFISKDSFPIEEAEIQEEEVSADATQAKENVKNGNSLSCSAWWKHHSAFLFSQAKQASTLWPIAIAAAFMGLIILGQRWQNQQLNLQVNTKDEKISRMLFQVTRKKRW